MATAAPVKIVGFCIDIDLSSKNIIFWETLNNSGFRRKRLEFLGFFCENNLKSVFTLHKDIDVLSPFSSKSENFDEN